MVLILSLFLLHLLNEQKLFSLVVNTPVDSTTYLAPALFQFMFFWVTFTENFYFHAVNNQHTIFFLDLTIKLSMSRVMFEHVHHVIKSDKWIVDCNNLYAIFFACCPGNQTSNSTKSVDSYLEYHFCFNLYKFAKYLNL